MGTKKTQDWERQLRESGWPEESIKRIRAFCGLFSENMAAEKKMPKLFRPGEGMIDKLDETHQDERMSREASAENEPTANVLRLPCVDAAKVRKLVEEAREKLEAGAFDLAESAVNIAMATTWSRWAESQPAGTIAPFDPVAALPSTGDPRLVLLHDLHCRMLAAAETLRSDEK